MAKKAPAKPGPVFLNPDQLVLTDGGPLHIDRCPVALSPGDGVYAVDFDLVTGDEKWPRGIGVVWERPRHKRSQVLVYLFGSCGPCLWPPNWLDYFGPLPDQYEYLKAKQARAKRPGSRGTVERKTKR